LLADYTGDKKIDYGTKSQVTLNSDIGIDNWDGQPMPLKSALEAFDKSSSSSSSTSGGDVSVFGATPAFLFDGEGEFTSGIASWSWGKYMEDSSSANDYLTKEVDQWANGDQWPQ